MSEFVGHNPEREFLKGDDIVTAADITIDGNNGAANIPITVTADCLPSLKGTQPETLEDLYPSGTSTSAQLGLNAHDAVATQMSRFILSNHLQNLDGSLPPRFDAVALFFNHCQRPIYISKGTPLFRFFKDTGESTLRGDELTSRIRNGLIKVQGIPGEDIIYSYDKYGQENGLYVRIKDENRGYIPAEIDGAQQGVLNYDFAHLPYLEKRKKIDSLLVPVPQDEKRILWIGETIEFQIDKSLEGILDRIATKQPGEYGFFDQLGIQTNSHLIDGGKTVWKIRVEVLSPTRKDLIPDYVHLHFIKNGYH